MKLLEKPTRVHVAVADEVWIATALLHKENPERRDFQVSEILNRAHQENLAGTMRPGVQTHVSYHCVANKPPNPGRYRMLYAAGTGTRRLFRQGDPQHPERTGKITPEQEAIPERYQFLLDWYHSVYAPPNAIDWVVSLRKLNGLGRQIWQGVNIDRYVRELREDGE